MKECNKTEMLRIYLSAKSLVAGKGLPKFSENHSMVVITPNFQYNEDIAMELAGFGLYGIYWAEMYLKLGLKNAKRAYKQVEKVYDKFKEECEDGM